MLGARGEPTGDDDILTNTAGSVPGELVRCAAGPARTRGRQGRTADLLPTPRPIERNTMPPLHTIPHRIVGKPCAGDHDEIAPAYTRRR